VSWLQKLLSVLAAMDIRATSSALGSGAVWDPENGDSTIKRAKAPRGALALVFFLLAAGTWSVKAAAVDEIEILVPDKVDIADPMVRLWLDAGSEEGLHVVAMHDSDFLRLSVTGHQVKGVILPDTIHRSASDVLVGAVSRYVEDGGFLLLVGDAGVIDQNNLYTHTSSRLSRLAGIEYCFYEELRDKAVAWGEVWGNQKVFSELHIPPGVGVHREYSGNSSHPANPIAEQGADLTVARYGEGDLLYPTFLTRGAYDGRVLLHSPSGVVAGLRTAGNGRVLYVNLLLGYLKGRTDGLLLHLFLNYFATSLLHLPSLSAVPDGIGGMVMNWHLDSNAALAPLETMQKAGIFEQGPYSIHLTAGPDAREFGDRLGLNVDGDPAIQAWIRYFSQHGHAIGSHGGWIHDYFGLHLREDNQKEFEKFLVLNKETLEKVVGRPIREYSAPIGNQPQWVTLWLQAHGIRAYYFTGNAGMAPTQTYRDGQKADEDGWSFPISHLGRVASFEEISRDKIPDTQVLQWLKDLADFCAEHHTARLFYSHPPGVIAYLGLMREWMETTASLAKAKKFRWYTMTQLGDFLDRRKELNWQLTQAGTGRQFLASRAPKDLAQMSWVCPAAIYGRPRVLIGNAIVQQKREDWLIVAQAGTRLKVEWSSYLS
jgi:hypothetical protein